MALAPAVRLGPNEIVSALGAGGMGEVYKARDTRLDLVRGTAAAGADELSVTRRAATRVVPS